MVATGVRPGGGSGNGWFATDHLEKDQAKRIEVRSLLDGLGARRSFGIEGIEMFGGHVRQSTTEQGPVDNRLARLIAGTGLGREIGRGGQVEVEQHGRAVGRDQDVGRFQVPVQQPP